MVLAVGSKRVAGGAGGDAGVVGAGGLIATRGGGAAGEATAGPAAARAAVSASIRARKSGCSRVHPRQLGDIVHAKRPLRRPVVLAPRDVQEVLDSWRRCSMVWVAAP